MQANRVMKVFFWVAFAVFLAASIPHVAYFFRAFEPTNGWWYWFIAYAIAISIDVTVFLLSMTVAELRHRHVSNWLTVSVWAFIVALAALSWAINWEYAMQFASNMLSKPSSYWFVAFFNPIVASCFQTLCIAYTWISDKIAQAEPVAQSSVHAQEDVQITVQEIAQPDAQSAQVEIAQPAQPAQEPEPVHSAQPAPVQLHSVQPKQVAQRGQCTPAQLAQIAQLHSQGMSRREIAQRVGVSASTVQNKLKEA